jgi:hypothetical protein
MMSELIVVAEVMVSAVLLLGWAAVEVVGYVTLLVHNIKNQRWLLIQRSVAPAREIRWGTAVRAAGLHGRRQHA